MGNDMDIYAPSPLDKGHTSRAQGAEAVKQWLERGLSLAEALYQVLRVEIITGIIPIGRRLRERDLSQEYGASRTPVREVLHRLNSEGFLTLTTKGLTVTEVSTAEIMDGWMIREQMLKIIVELAIERAWPEELVELSNIINSVRVEVERGDGMQALKLTIAYEEQLFRAAHSRTAMRVFSASIGPPGRMPLLLKDPKRLAAATEERAMILEAIVAKDKDRAIEAVETHTRNGRQNRYSLGHQT